MITAPKITDDRLQVFGPDGTQRRHEYLVFGKATAQVVDSHNEVVDVAATQKAFDDFARNRAVVCVNHDLLPVGHVAYLQFEAEPVRHVSVVLSITDYRAWSLIVDGTLAALSVGYGERRTLETFDKGCCRSMFYRVREISLVSRPACPSCYFEGLWNCGIWRTPPRISEQIQAETRNMFGSIRPQEVDVSGPRRAL